MVYGQEINMKDFTGSLILWCLGIACILGYIMNFENLFSYPSSSSEFIVSIIGVFVPVLGVVTGWIW